MALNQSNVIELEKHKYLRTLNIRPDLNSNNAVAVELEHVRSKLKDFRGTGNLKSSLIFARTRSGPSVMELSYELPVLMVLLGNLNYPYSRDLLEKLAEEREDIELEGATMLLVHMEADHEASKVLASHELDDVNRIQDKGRRLYRAFRLTRNRFKSSLHPSFIWASLRAALKLLFQPAAEKADVRQRPGIFLVYRGRILNSFRPQAVDQLPDFHRMSNW